MLRAGLVAFSLLAAGSAAAQTTQQPILSGDARVQPVLARQGMVVSQEADATRVGVDILRRGGNAVDAAVATGFALAVTLPRAGNLGGGGFMLIHLAERNLTTSIDHRETAPAAATPTMFLDETGTPDPRRSRDGGLAVGVPGTVAGLVMAHRLYGSGTFSLAELIAPAIRLARAGIVVDLDLADTLPRARERFLRHPASAAIFLSPDGSVPPRFSRLVQDDLAATLERIAVSGPEGFYRGETARRIVETVRAAGGVMTLDDLATYRAIERQPVRGTYRGHAIVSMGPPSSGGVHLIQILNMLERFDLGASGFGAAATLHPMIEAMKLAYADRAAHLGDPDFVKVPVSGLISRRYADQLAATIDAEKARPARDIRPGDPLPFEGDQTTHYSVIDRAGNAVAVTTTLNFSYGTGMVAAGTGVLLNNEMDDFAARAGAMNAYGLVQGAQNLPEPGKRPLSSMSPTLVMKDGKVLLVTGTPGGSRIITTVLQVISNVVDHGMNIAEAVAAPRLHHQWLPDTVMMERGFSPDTIRLLEARGHRVETGATSGSANSILVTPQAITGAADTRQRGTLAAGF
jgi:gamma-glutamyltranspeptidase/glutathione hydrolase